MSKRTGRQGPEDTNETAFRVVQQLTGQTPSDPLPELSAKRAEAGRLGGLKGGKARAEKLTSDQRIEIAQKAVRARWGAKEDAGS